MSLGSSFIHSGSLGEVAEQDFDVPDGVAYNGSQDRCIEQGEALCLEGLGNAEGKGGQCVHSTFMGGHEMIMAFLSLCLAPSYDFYIF